MEGFFDDKMKNEELFNYIINSEILYSNIPSDDYLRIFLKLIELKTASEDFI